MLTFDLLHVRFFSLREITCSHSLSLASTLRLPLALSLALSRSVARTLSLALSWLCGALSCLLARCRDFVTRAVDFVFN